MLFLKKNQFSFEYSEISSSGLFSPDWYLARYPDVAAAGIDPLEHYLRHGVAEERDPCPEFSTSGYLKRYPDVAEDGINPLLHYIRHGKDEARNPAPLLKGDYPAKDDQRAPLRLEQKEFESQIELIRTSNLFDETWYREKYPEVTDDPAGDYLSGAYLHYRNPGPLFDTAFYLKTYTDVAKAGQNPLVHYILYGIDEGRLPKAGRARILERKLWGGFSTYALNELESLKHFHRTPEPERISAAWSLMRWYYTRQEYARVLDNFAFACNFRSRLKDFKRWTLPAAHSLFKLGNSGAARNLLKHTLEKRGPNSDLFLSLSNTWFVPQAESRFLWEMDNRRLAWLNRVFEANGLTTVCKADGNAPLALGNLRTLFLQKAPDTARAKISVIMPAYNAADTISIALDSLLRQSWDNLEILVVDDCSTDDTYDVVRDYAARDGRIIPLRHETNQGAYPARNTALKSSSGSFITVHDCDDWSHPEKLEAQIIPLLNDGDLMGTFTNWVRVDEKMIFLGGWRPWDNLIEFNHSSFLFRREMMDALGEWDNVRVGGDTEFIWRAEAHFGEEKFLRLHKDVPFSFALNSETSLTMAKATHVRTIDFGLRRLYREAASWWHRSCSHAGNLYLCNASEERRFPAPAANLRVACDEKISIVFIADFAAGGHDLALVYEKILSVVHRREKAAIFHWPDYLSDCDRPLDDQVFKLASEFGVRILSPGDVAGAQRIVLMQPEVLRWRLDSIPSIDCSDIVIAACGKTGEVPHLDIVQANLELFFGKKGSVSPIWDLLPPDETGSAPVETRERKLMQVQDLLVEKNSPSDSEKLNSASFSSEWYLCQYPDVAAAGMDPLEHYLRHGRFEGRLPCELSSLTLERQLWSLQMPEALSGLEQLAAGAGLDAAVAGWVLARWHGSHGRWADAEQRISLFFAEPGASTIVPHQGPWLLHFSALFHQGKFAQAGNLLQQEGWPETADHALAGLMVADQADKLGTLNALLARFGLSPLQLADETCPLSLDNLSSPAQPRPGLIQRVRQRPVVTVIIPCFNAQATIATALKGVLQQSWRNLEILVVDDASTDGSVAVVEALAAGDPRIRLLRHSENQGAYSARNTALAVAGGQFITTHDSDDWSHPRKIELQVEALLSRPQAVASVSHWVRTTPELVFSRWRMEEGWIYRNVSSLMFRRNVFEKLGYWDRVSVNADTEYYYRLLRGFGRQSVIEVLPGVPLSFGRSDAGSLSQTGATHLRTQFKGVRKDYHDAALRWHASVADAAELYLPATPQRRPFLAPAAICRGARDVEAPHPKDVVQQSGMFDGAWYLRTYLDLQQTLMEPLEHYWEYGAAEGRDPGPDFSTTGYMARYPDVEANPLVHYLTIGKAQGRQSMPTFAGAPAERKGRPMVLVCTHQAGAQLYGAERSLLDILGALDALGMNVAVTLPSACNIDYLDAVRAKARAVVVLPYSWWRAERQSCTSTCRHFESLIRQYDVDAVYVNTLVLDEPLEAARASGVPLIVHVRELPEQDVSLCELMGAPPHRIAERIRHLADCVVANSRAVVHAIGADKALMVPNVIDVAEFDILPPASGGLAVALISSNLPKKGVEDFAAVATKLARVRSNLRCLLIGPDSPWVQDLRARQDTGEIPPSLHFAGYAASPQEALAQANIVLNLSHFQESFGRTVLEAMAAARPVVCYAWGALPELVEDGETGYLVPFGDVDAAVERILLLADNPDLRRKLGKAARKRAEELFSRQTMTERLREVFDSVLKV
jgi:glycosyltransferase involved in cell wall biosynthesis